MKFVKAFLLCCLCVLTGCQRQVDDGMLSTTQHPMKLKPLPASPTRTTLYYPEGFYDEQYGARYRSALGWWSQ